MCGQWISVVMAPYHTGFDESGRVTFSYYRERLIKNHTGLGWVGVPAVVELLPGLQFLSRVQLRLVDP